MLNFLPAFCDAVDRLAVMTGRAVMGCALAMVVAQCGVILARSVFGYGTPWLQESLTYFHVTLVLFAAAWTLQAGGHVRIDIFYASATPRARAWIDLLGAIVLLLPFMATVMWLAAPYALRAWRLLEGSRESGGLPLVFVLKTMIPLFALHLFLQGLAQAGRALMRLMTRDEMAAT